MQTVQIRSKFLRFHLFWLFAFSPLFLFSQGEGNIWYFGDNAGLDFNGGAPLALTNSAMITNEGCATISNPSGSLLFYTDGSTVYDRTHTPMPNGFLLMGSASSTQSAVVVPQPGNPNLFFIFTVDDLAGPNGLRYSIVDMNLNGGNGDITTKNVLLLNTTTEKITAVNHANRFDLWVIGHAYNSNEFYAWEITSAGLNPTPVISAVGPVHTGANNLNTLGYLKAAGTGDKLACAVYDEERYELYDFDNLTGQASNPIILQDPAFLRAYGVEFSPDGTKLYGSVDNGSGEIYQFDLSSGTQAGILASALQVGNSISGSIGALQLAPDGKIYLSRFNGTRLGEISDPDVLGLGCNYTDNGPSLNGRICRLGLPTFIQSFFTTPMILAGDTCLPANVPFELSSTVGLDSVLWNFGDPGSGSANTSNLLTPFHQFSDSGTFFISCEIFYGIFSDTLYDTITITMPPSVNLGADQTLCNQNSLLLDATFPGASYLWQDQSTAGTLTANSNGTYWVELSNVCGTDRDSIDLVFSENIVLNLGPPRDLCEGETVLLDATNVDATYLWQDGSSNPEFEVTQTGLFFVEVQNPCGIARDSVEITIHPNPVVDIPADTSVCKGVPVFVDAGPGFSSYRWSHGPDDQSVELVDEGRYTVQVRDQFGCRGTGVFELFHEICLIGLYVPNAFTPNGDGTNDFFFAVENNVTLQELSVFNRWGQKLITLNSAAESWDGTTNGQPCPEGVYVWRAKALDDKGVEFIRQGTITLIR